MTLFARALHDDGHLCPGVSPREARDVLWTYNSAELFQLLVLERRWSPKRYGRWVADALISALLPHPAALKLADAPPPQVGENDAAPRSGPDGRSARGRVAR
jgi:hypothetical protein